MKISSISLIIIICLSLFLFGCGPSIDTSGEKVSVPGSGDSLRDGDLLIKVVSKKLYDNKTDRKPLAGKVFIELTLDLINESDDLWDSSSWDYTIEDTSGKTIEGFIDISDPSGGTIRQDIDPSKTLRLKLIYEVPEDMKGLILTTFNSDGVKL